MVAINCSQSNWYHFSVSSRIPGTELLPTIAGKGKFVISFARQSRTNGGNKPGSLSLPVWLGVRWKIFPNVIPNSLMMPFAFLSANCKWFGRLYKWKHVDLNWIHMRVSPSTNLSLYLKGIFGNFSLLPKNAISWARKYAAYICSVVRINASLQPKQTNSLTNPYKM